MPELPELQAHAERLSEQFAGAPVDRFRALTFTALKTAVPDPSTAPAPPPPPFHATESGMPTTIWRFFTVKPAEL